VGPAGGSRHLIRDIKPNSEAAALLLVDDVIVAINSVPVTPMTSAEVTGLFRSGTQIRLTIQRATETALRRLSSSDRGGHSRAVERGRDGASEVVPVDTEEQDEGEEEGATISVEVLLERNLPADHLGFQIGEPETGELAGMIACGSLSPS